MDHEIELKFLIAPEAADAILERLDGAAELRRLDATYYDTEDHRLRAAGFGLRVRDGEGGRKQTLKSAAAGGVFARGEWEGAIIGPGPDLAALADTPAGPVLNGAPLVALFSAQVERAARQVERGGARIEAVLDRGELIAGDRRQPICELELELKSGPAAALFDLARDLADHAPLRLSLVSKAERGYALALGETDRRREPPILSPGLTAGEALQALGRGALAQLCARGETLRTRPGPEAVHQLRVSSRRLRALLSTFKALAADPAAGRLKAELKWLANELDAARNLDVLIGEVWRPAAEAADDDAAHGGMAAFGRALVTAQGQAYDRAAAAVDSARFRALTLEAAAWLEAGVWTRDPDLAETRDQPAPAFAAQALGRRARPILKAGRGLAQLEAEPRHRLRIRGKKLRYAAEDLAPLFPKHPKRAKRFIAAIRALQDALGGLNDRAFAADLARTVALAADDPEAAFAAGRLTAAHAGDEAALLKAAEQAVADLAAVKPFWRG